MDRFFEAKQQEGLELKKVDLHIIGLASIFLSSKFEDVIPIHME
jgi:hypothetical protein